MSGIPQTGDDNCAQRCLPAGNTVDDKIKIATKNTVLPNVVPFFILFSLKGFDFD
jgi:hypothetical protein